MRTIISFLLALALVIPTGAGAQSISTTFHFGQEPVTVRFYAHVPLLERTVQRACLVYASDDGQSGQSCYEVWPACASFDRAPESRCDTPRDSGPEFRTLTLNRLPAGHYRAVLVVEWIDEKGEDRTKVTPAQQFEVTSRL